MTQSGGSFGNRYIDRRDFLKLGGMGAAGTLLLGSAGCGILGGGSSQGGQKPLVFSTSGGAGTVATRKGWLKPFTEQTGIEAVTQAPTDYAQLRSMVEAGQVTWNVLFITQILVGDEEEARNYFEPVDYSIVKADGVPENLRRKFGVGALQYSLVLAYNNEQLQEEPQSWADFFDVERFPGKRAFPGSYVEYYFPLEIALMGDGVAPEDLYPLDIDRALAKIETIRDDIVFFEGASEGEQLLRDGEVVMADIYHSRTGLLEQEGLPIRTQWNQNVSVVDYLGVAKGASRVDASFRLIDFATSADNNFRYTEYNPDAPVNRDSADRIPKGLAEYLPVYGDRLDRAMNPDLNWWATNLDEASRRYEQWLLG